MDKSSDPFHFNIDCCDLIVEEGAEDIEGLLNTNHDEDDIEVIEIDYSSCDTIKESTPSVSRVSSSTVDRRAEYGNYIGQDIEDSLYFTNPNENDIEVITIDDSSCDSIKESTPNVSRVSGQSPPVYQRAEYDNYIGQVEQESEKFYYQATSGNETIGVVKECSKEIALQIDDDATLLDKSCLLASNYESALCTDHETSINTTPNTYTWEGCSDIFTEKGDLSIHPNTVDLYKETTLQIDDDATLLDKSCLLTSTNYESALSIDHETSINTTPNTYTWEGCSEIFTEKGDLLIHPNTVDLCKATTLQIDDDATLLDKSCLLTSTNYESALSIDHETSINTTPNTYTWGGCSEIFTEKGDLLIHHNTVDLHKESTKETTLQIDCDASILKESSLLTSNNNHEAAISTDHKTAINTNPRTFTSERCAEILSEKKDLLIHCSTVDLHKETNKETTLQIDDDTAFVKESHLHTINNYEAEKSTEHETTININPKTYSCKNCSEIFTEKVDLLIHHKTIHLRIYAYTCNLCKRSFPSIGKLVAHKKMMHKHTNSYSCIICKKSFRLKRMLTSHNIKSHGQTKYYARDTCNATFGLKVNLTNQQTKAHITKETNSLVNAEIGGKKHIASETVSSKMCTKSFNSIRVLKAHERTHIRQYPFSCKACNKNFRLKKRLNWHIKLVHNQMSPDCLQARKQTFNPAEINSTAQEKKLNEDENYQCDKCKECFTCKNSIILHLQKVHNPNNSHICKLCNNSYRLKSKLDHHVKMIHRRVKLECPDQRLKITCSDDVNSTTGIDRKLSEPDNTQQKVETLLSCKVSNIIRHYPFNCKICKKNFRLKKKLQCHLKLVHNQNHISRQSQSRKQTFSSYDINNTAHEHIINEEENYQCDKCKECLSFKSSLILHLKKAHNPNYPFIGEIANELYSLKSKLGRHVKQFHHQSSLECPNLEGKIIEKYCHQCDNFKHNLENTLAYNTNKELKQPISLLSIDSKYPQNNNVEVWSSSETVEKLANSEVSTLVDSKNPLLNHHPCKSCNLSFHHKEISVDHERANPNQNLKYAYLCNICRKPFRLHFKLKQHMKAFHHEVKRKLIKATKSEFSSKLNNVIIEGIRSRDLKPYQCNNCNLSFKFKSTLVDHQRQNHKTQKFYSCTICKMTYRFKRKLHHHLKTMHCPYNSLEKK